VQLTSIYIHQSHTVRVVIDLRFFCGKIFQGLEKNVPGFGKIMFCSRAIGWKNHFALNHFAKKIAGRVPSRGAHRTGNPHRPVGHRAYN
jgi:hypothetical protein